jgi:hypothetical protein
MTTLSYFSISILSFHLRLGLSGILFWFPYQYPICIPLVSRAYLIFLDFSLVIFREKYKLLISALCSFIQPHNISSLFGPGILSAFFP